MGATDCSSNGFGEDIQQAVFVVGLAKLPFHGCSNADGQDQGGYAVDRSWANVFVLHIRDVLLDRCLEVYGILLEMLRARSDNGPFDASVKKPVIQNCMGFVTIINNIKPELIHHTDKSFLLRD